MQMITVLPAPPRPVLPMLVVGLVVLAGGLTLAVRDDGWLDAWRTMQASQRRIQYEGPGGWARIQIAGKAQFNALGDDLLALDGSVRVEARLDGQRRRIDFRAAPQGFVRQYRVNGEVQAFDAEARRWLARVMRPVIEDARKSEG